MGGCKSCTKLRPIKKASVDSGCKKKKQRIDEIRVFCPETLNEVIGETVDSGCINGYVSNLVNPDNECNPYPIVSVDVLNPDEVDELNDYTFDRTEDTGEDVYSLSPIKIKVYDPEIQCTLDSWKGKDLGIIYRIINKEGVYQWRRIYAKMSGVTGGLIAGYELTFDIVNPSEEQKPMFIDFGGIDVTTSAIDLMTAFDGEMDCVTIAYSAMYVANDRIDVDSNEFTLPVDSSKIALFRQGMLMSENIGYTISNNGFDINNPIPNANYRIIVYT